MEAPFGIIMVLTAKEYKNLKDDPYNLKMVDDLKKTGLPHYLILSKADEYVEEAEGDDYLELK